MRILLLALFVLFTQNIFAKSVPGEFIVKLKKGAVIDDLGDLSPLSFSSAKYISKKHRLCKLIIQGEIYKQDVILESLNNDDVIELAEPNFIYSFKKDSNDEFIASLWGHHNFGQEVRGKETVAGVDTDLREAWDIHTGSESHIVAVIDTGIDYNHPDLKNNIWTNQAEKNGEPGKDDDGNGYVDDIHGYDFVNNDGDPLDDNNHGTHCAGIIGAEGNNQIGITGVNWKTSLMAVKFLNDFGSGTLENAIMAIDYATDNGAKITNNSWSGGDYSELLNEAIQRSEKKNILFVAAAGNASNNNDTLPRYPSSYENKNILSVAAIDAKGNLASFSNFGLVNVDVAAPGVDVFSTVIDGKYEFLSGTSMATPYVAGIANLILSKNKSYSYKQIKRRILKYATPKFRLKKKILTAGMANAYFSLTEKDPPEDINDPIRLKQYKEINLVTKHPYDATVEHRYKVYVPEAKEMSLHFTKFLTEVYYDVLEIVDPKSKKVLATMSGDYGEDYSTQIFKTNQLEVIFKSDLSNQDYGFEIDRVYYE